MRGRERERERETSHRADSGCCHRDGRKTVTAMDVVYALKRNEWLFTGDEPPKEKLI